MSVITIPFGYEDLPDSERTSIVPIAIPALDDDGSQIAWGWFEAVEAVQNPLRGLARSLLGDIWRVSEMTESAVKTVWRNHGEDYGHSPGGRIYAQARWCARDMRAGSSRDRRGLNVRLDEFDRTLRERLLVDPCDYDKVYTIDMDLAELGRQLRERGLEDIDIMLQLVRNGCNWKEIGLEISQDPNVAQRRFRRWMDKAGQMLGIGG